MKHFFTILLLILSSLSFSQLSNKHWIPPLHGTAQSNGSSLIEAHYLYLSTPEPTAFQVTVKNGAGVEILGSPFTISQGNPVTITIGTAQPSVMFLDKADVGSVVSGKGLIIEGRYDFYASFRVRAYYHAEFLSSKGITGAGKVFRLGSIPQNYETSVRNFVSSFMATEDNTTVNLSDYDPNLIFINGNGFLTTPNQTFILNKGQSVVVSGNCTSASLSANFTGFIGALLESDKPIVVNTGNLAGGMTNSGQDFILDQIVPLEQVGSEYIVVKGSENDQSEFPLAIAHEDNTQIFLNGSLTPIITLNAGEYFLVPPSNYSGVTGNKNMYITGNKKFFLYQIVSGSSTSNATSGFFFIPPLSCFWQKSVDAIPSFDYIGNLRYDNSEVLILTETGSIVKVNNVPTTELPQPVAGNASWESYKIRGLTGDVKVESTGAIAVGVFGSGATDPSSSAGFGGYFSGFGSIPNDSQTVVCTGNIVDLFNRIPGNPEVGGDWFFGGVKRVPNDGFFDPSVDLQGVYTYTFTKTCNGVIRVYPIKIDVSIQQGPNAGTGLSKAYCTTDSIEDLFSLLGSGVTTGGNWTFNNTTRSNGLIDPSTDLSGNYTYTIPATGVCEPVSTIIVVTINAAPLVTAISDYEECDTILVDNDDANGQTVFTLSNKDSDVLNGQTGMMVTYHDLESQAIAGTSAITTIHSSNRIIYARITNTTTNCYSVTSFNLVVNPKPVVLAEVNLKQCDDDTDARTYFNLTSANELISTDNTLSFSYHNTENGAINNTDFVSNDRDFNAINGTVVWARIKNGKSCFRTAKVNLVVSTTQIPSTFNPAPLEECDEYVGIDNLANDGYDVFDIDTAFTQQILNVFTAGQQPFLVITYYESYNDALLISNPIVDLVNYRNSTPINQSIWARIDSRLNTDSGCQGIKELKLKVNPLPIINLGNDFILCLDPETGFGTKIIDATPTIVGDYSYEWTPSNLNVDLAGNESSQFNVIQGGNYKVKVTNNLTGCVSNDEIDVDYSSEPEVFNAVIATPALTSTTINIVCESIGGYGEYEYSLNLVDWQLDPVFLNLPNGSYTAYVRDVKGCGVKWVENLFGVTYPNFFTPNGDGINDTWNIKDLDASYEAKIYIYDRYGKLLKFITPYTPGWNGTFNGNLLPSTDYWFRIEYIENNIKKEFKSHFSLKR